jgi:hypothetical protein
MYTYYYDPCFVQLTHETFTQRFRTLIPRGDGATEHQCKSVQISAVPASAEQGGDLVLPCLRKHVRQAVQQRKRRVVPGLACLNKPPPTAEACKMQNTIFLPFGQVEQSR